MLVKRKVIGPILKCSFCTRCNVCSPYKNVASPLTVSCSISPCLRNESFGVCSILSTTKQLVVEAITCMLITPIMRRNTPSGAHEFLSPTSLSHLSAVCFGLAFILVSLWPLSVGALHYHVLVLCAIKCNMSLRPSKVCYNLGHQGYTPRHKVMASTLGLHCALDLAP